MKFRCPLCGCARYARVIVERPNGEPYRSDLFHCTGCTLVFLEPELLTDVPNYRASAPPADTHLMCHEEALDNQALLLRYWKARLKRRDGGIEPKDDAVVRYRLRMER